MKIIFRKRFKELRNEYADLGDMKLDIIEERVNAHPTWEICDFLIATDGFGKRKPLTDAALSDLNLSRSVEYLMKYRKLVQLRDNIRVGVAGTAFSILTLGLFGYGIKVSKNNRTLKEEYIRGCIEGRENQAKDWIEIAENYGGEKAWLSDTDDGKHVYIMVSDEETEEYKEYFKNTD